MGVLSTRLLGEDKVRYVVATLQLLYGTVPLLLIPLMCRLYRAQMARLAGAGRTP